MEVFRLCLSPPRWNRIRFEHWSGTSSVHGSYIPLRISLWLLLLIEPLPKTRFLVGFVECIKLSGGETLLVGHVRAHDTRVLRTSWPLFNGASTEQILRQSFGPSVIPPSRVILRMSSPMRLFIATASSGISGSDPSRSARLSLGPQVSVYFIFHPDCF